MADTTLQTTPASAKPATDTTNKAKSASRYAGVFSMGGIGIFMFLGTFPPDQQTAILKSAHTMYESLRSFVGAAADIWFIVFPAVAIWLGKMGVDASGINNMMTRIFAMAKAGNLDAKIAIVNAAASREIGSQGVVNAELAANPATAGNVVAAPALVPKSAPENPMPASA